MSTTEYVWADTVPKSPKTSTQGGQKGRGPVFRMSEKTLADRIKAAMAGAGITTPSELARRMQVSRQTVQNWVNGRSDRITPEMLYKLCDATNVNGRWMALGPPHSPTKPRFVSPEEDELITIARELTDEARDQWLSLGRTLVAATGKTSKANPYHSTPPRRRT